MTNDLYNEELRLARAAVEGALTMWYVYVLRSCADGKQYIGMTSQSLEERLRRHSAGRVKSTKGRQPFTLRASFLVIYLPFSVRSFTKVCAHHEGVATKALKRIPARHGG